ncbi:MAG: nucleotide sugar dehydrogenase [Candidatus Njordarchaeia archaeon]
MGLLDGDKNFFQTKIKNKELTVTVFGLGNVGLPMAVAFAMKGCKVIGVDVDEKKVEMLNRGEVYLPHEPYMDRIKDLIKEDLFVATVDADWAVKNSDVILILVPLFADEKYGIDFSNIIDVSKKIGKNLRKQTLVILSTTVPPGTTEGIVQWLIERESGLRAGEDFALAFVPERTKSGTVIEDFLRNYPIIVGGVNKRSTDAITGFYEAIVENKVIKVSSARAAELTKLFKAIYRYFNIVLADEYAKISEMVGVDVKEAIEAANTDPFSHVHWPSPGIGGHCIPVYPYFLEFVMSLYDRDFKLFRVAKEIDKGMSDHVIHLLFEALNRVKKTINGSRIAILGVAFRGDVKVTYNSPAKAIIEKIVALGGNIIAHDTMLSPAEIEKEFHVRGTNDLEEALTNADAVVIVTDHNLYKKLTLEKFVERMAHPSVIVDTRNLLPREEIKKYEGKVVYRGIGRSGYLFSLPNDFMSRFREYIKKLYNV